MHSLLLAGAVLAGLPVLLHLIMKQEPKRVPFPAFRFLKQMHRTNQRKLRLRHFVLLALRVLLIALFAAALYQPTALSEGFVVLSGERPVAVVVVLDTTPSMGYLLDDKSRLDEARRRAGELLDDLPGGSRVAVVETGDDSPPAWLPSAADARRRLDAVKAPRGPSRPVSAALAAAYQLLAAPDPDADPGEPPQRLVAVFTDRAQASWDAARTDELKAVRDAAKPAHAVVDVGADAPIDVAVVAADVGPPQVVPGNVPVLVNVSVAAAGADVEVGVRCRLDGAAAPDRRAVKVAAGTTAAVAFEFRDLKPGLHQAAVGLDGTDRLPADNTRFVTFRVAEPRRVLAVSDDPDVALLWKLALDGKGDFACDVVKSDAAADPKFDLSPFEVVTLLSVAAPNRPGDHPLWANVLRYVDAGGKLLVVPGGEDTVPDEYDPTKPTDGNATALLMPGTLKRIVTARDEFPEPAKPADPKATPPPDRRGGVAWDLGDGPDSRVLQHPLLAPFREWRRLGTIDFLRSPRKATKFWEVDPAPGAAVVVRYDSSDDPAKRFPAVLERAAGKNGGKVVLLTTRLDVRPERDQIWNDYWAGTSWGVVLPDLLVTYLAGSRADAAFNFPTGRTVPLALPRGGAGRLILDGPGIVGKDAELTRGDRQTELRLGPPRTDAPGNFTVATEDRKWADGFSLNVPAEEWALEKVPAAAIEAVTGPGTVHPVDKNVRLRDVLQTQLGQPVDLFPWLLIGVLLLLAVEGLVANRFYRTRPR